MGRRSKVGSNKIEADYILHIPHTLGDLLRSSIEREPVNFDNVKGYNDGEAGVCFLKTDIEEGKDKAEIFENKTTGFQILRNFSVNEESTDICCWWCCHSFSTRPLGLPFAYNDKHFKVKGCFCSFNCILAYNEEDKTSNGRNCDKKYLIVSMYKMLTGKIFGDYISPSPPRELLKMFGGPYNIREYRNKFNTFEGKREVTYKKLDFPLVSANIQVEEKIHVVKQAVASKLNDSRVDKAVENIKNNKPVNNTLPAVKNIKKTKLTDFFNM